VPPPSWLLLKSTDVVLLLKFRRCGPSALSLTSGQAAAPSHRRSSRSKLRLHIPPDVVALAHANGVQRSAPSTQTNLHRRPAWTAGRPRSAAPARAAVLLRALSTDTACARSGSAVVYGRGKPVGGRKLRKQIGLALAQASFQKACKSHKLENQKLKHKQTSPKSASDGWSCMSLLWLCLLPQKKSTVQTKDFPSH
jgi:hypothetical protein